MITRIIKGFKVFILVMCSAMTVYAAPDTTQKSEIPANGEAVLDLDAPHPRTKRIPSRNVLEVVYADGIITLESEYYGGAFSLSFANCETGDTYEVPSIQVGQSAPLELEYGEYQVNAIGEDGSHLSGFMEVY